MASLVHVLAMVLVCCATAQKSDKAETPQAETAAKKRTPPHVIVILVDDVGWADFSYSNPEGPIKTPHLDALSARGIRLDAHYAHPTCTPSRAALMTGRYSANVGLTFAMLPGSPAGLPLDVSTMPQLFRKAGYEAHMVGKWHLGYTKWAQTPVGRGFQTQVGMMLWDIDSYTKQMYREPWTPLSVDWMRADEDRTFTHWAEPRHATIAITDESEARIRQHKATSTKPLFLYVAYTAAHSPLQPLPEHAEQCSDIPHLWRRQYCGMVVGLDEGIKNLTDTAADVLGDNLLIVVASDNGGTTWFGGLNYPLRSGKYTGFEGGVRVPAFIVDFSNDKRYLGTSDHAWKGCSNALIGGGGRVFRGLFHMVDWLPTLLSAAGVPASTLAAIDGVDQLPALRRTGTKEEEPVYQRRQEVLLDIYSVDENVFGDAAVAFRQGKYKLLEGTFRDPHWYKEPTSDWMNTSDTGWVATVGELVVRGLEDIFGAGPFDTARTAITSNVFHQRYKDAGTGVFLYDIEADPGETNNLAESNPEVVQELRDRVEHLRAARPIPQQKYWMTVDLEEAYMATFVPGNCSMNKDIEAEFCRFVHPFLADDHDVSSMELIDGQEWAQRRMLSIVLRGLRTLLLSILGAAVIARFVLLFRCRRGGLLRTAPEDR